MFADISFFNSLSSGGGTFVAISELLPLLKEYAEKSTGSFLCSQWLDSIRDRNDVTADLTARLADATHDYDKEKIETASKLKEQMGGGDVKPDQEDTEYLGTLEQGVQQEIKALLEKAFDDWKKSMEVQLAQGADLSDMLEGNPALQSGTADYQVSKPSNGGLGIPSATPAPTVPDSSAPMMANDISDVEY